MGIGNESEGPMYGLQVGLWSSTASLYGAQIGFLNGSYGDHRERTGGFYQGGVQIGVMNISEESNFAGFRIGLFNFGDDFTGVQAGLGNNSKSLHGFEIGLMNFYDEDRSSGVSIGLFNSAPPYFLFGFPWADNK